MTRTVTAKMELSLHRRSNDGYVAEVRFVPPSGDVEIDMLLDRAAPIVIDQELLIEQTISPDEYGQTLTAGLFGGRAGPLASAYREAQRMAADQHVPLEIQLVIGPTASKLHAIRWETLCDPHDGAPLFIGDTITLTRYLSSSHHSYAGLRARGDMQALVVIADTPGEQFGLAPIDATRERAIVAEGLGGIAHTVLTGVGNLQISTMISAIREGYDIFYLVAHGILSEKGPHLWLEDEEGAGKWIPAKKLIEQLKRATVIPRLAILASCMSAGSGLPDLESVTMRRALGPLLAQSGIPAVIAMQGNLSIATAGRLLPTFLRELQRDGQVARALSVARGEVSDREDWWMPALFSRLRRGCLWLEPNEAAPPLTPAELEEGLRRLEQLGPLHGSSLAADVIRTVPAVRATLEQPKADLGEQVSLYGDLDRISAAVTGRDFTHLARDPRIDLNPPAEPFRGLQAFGHSKEDVRFFKGREELVQRMAERLEQERLLAAIGQSGSGKSSLVFAGVIPALEARRSGGELHVASFRPGKHPLSQWDAVLAETGGAVDLLIIDQFEEIFTLCEDESERCTFIDRFMATASEQMTAITMRADFQHECMAYPDLHRLLVKHQELIYAMQPTELQRAIELQAQEGRVVFEAGLTQLILEHVANEPGRMPLLQHALRETWKRRYGRWLRTDDYQACGQMWGAIAETADKIYLELDERERALMRHVFTRLTRLDSDRSTSEQRDTRQRLRLSDLVTDVTPEPDLRRLIDRLVTERLLVTSMAIQKDKPVTEVEVAHEALIRYWPQLREWLTSGRVHKLFEQTIKSAALEWENGNYDTALIMHRGRRIEQAQELIAAQQIALSQLDQRYINACLKVSKQEQPLKFVDQMRWAVIVNAREDTAVLKALTPLIMHRALQQGCAIDPEYLTFQSGENCGAWYKRICGDTSTHREQWLKLPPVLIYRPNESPRAFLNRHGVSLGMVEPWRLPYYLLIVGRPGPYSETDDTFVPFQFQYILDIQYGVGRLHFEDLAAYERYAASVIASESGHMRLPRQIALFGTRHEDDISTIRTHDELLIPLANYLREELPGWKTQSHLAEAATRDRLMDLLGGELTPALLFTSTHGLGLPISDERLVKHQGALITAEWSGYSNIRREHWFAGEDVAATARFLGSMTFLWSCYSAGTPERDEFIFDEDKSRPQIAPYALISHLPQRLLSHPEGGMLAVIGKIERSWTTSFTDGPVTSSIGTFTTSIQRLVEGYPVGAALEPFNGRYCALAAGLVTELERRNFATGASDTDLAKLWLERGDAQNFVLIGDPATRLPIGDSMEPASRPSFADLRALSDTVERTGNDVSAEPLPSDSTIAHISA